MIRFACLGAQNPETIRTIGTIEKQNSAFRCVGFLDSNSTKWGSDFFGYPVLGGHEKVAELAKKGISFCNLVASTTRARYESSKDLVGRGAKFINLIHPDCMVDMVTLGSGVYMQDHVVVQAGVAIGDHSHFQSCSFIGHEGKIGNCVLVSPGCTVASFVNLEDGVYLGAGVTIIPHITIGRWSVIGAGAVIIRDVPPYSVVVGNPGRVIKKHDVPYADGRISDG